VRVVGEGGKGTFIVAKRRGRHDVRSGGLNQKRRRTSIDVTVYVQLAERKGPKCSSYQVELDYYHGGELDR